MYTSPLLSVLSLVRTSRIQIGQISPYFGSRLVSSTGMSDSGSSGTSRQVTLGLIRYPRSPWRSREVQPARRGTPAPPPGSAPSARPVTGGQPEMSASYGSGRTSRSEERRVGKEG